MISIKEIAVRTIGDKWDCVDKEGQSIVFIIIKKKAILILCLFNIMYFILYIIPKSNLDMI